MPRSLYICYFGLDQPLVRTQVIPYLVELSKGGYEIELLTFEPEAKIRWTPDKIAEERTSLAEQGIEWHFLPYHKRLSALATSWDIFHGARWIHSRIARYDILHGRAHVAALMGALARQLASHKPKLLFDIRGFMPEEYTDAGVWPEGGAIYRASKRAERWLLEVSDGFVVLTEKARDILFSSEARPVEVIPCCVDLKSRFPSDTASVRAEMRQRLGIEHRRVFAHIGALGGLYLTEELADFLALARQVDPRTYAIFLTQTENTAITAGLKKRGFFEGDFHIGRVAPDDIPAYLAASDAGLSFVQATYSTASRSPTKIPEYLAAGLPVIANRGVGDVDALIRGEGVGVLIGRFDRAEYLRALEKFDQLGDISDRCRDAAQRLFDLETVGGVRYRGLYEKLLQS